MSSLDNLVAKIIKDSHDKGSALIKNAEEDAARAVAARSAEAEKARAALLEEGRREAEMRKSLIISAKRIEARDGMLKTKQGLIEKAFAAAVEKLGGLDLEGYQKFLDKYLLQLELAGDEEIFVPEKYAGVSLDAVNAKINGNLRLGKGSVKNGFLVAKGGVENNNTYEALLDFYRGDLEKIVAENMF